MNAKLVLAICGCALTGLLVYMTSGKVEAQSAEAPARTVRLSTAGTGAIWGDEQNVFVLVGDRLFKVRKYDMKIDRSVALRSTGTTTSSSSAQRIAPKKKVKKTRTKTQPVVTDEE